MIFSLEPYIVALSRFNAKKDNTKSECVTLKRFLFTKCTQRKFNILLKLIVICIVKLI